MQPRRTAALCSRSTSLMPRKASRLRTLLQLGALTLGLLVASIILLAWQPKTVHVTLGQNAAVQNVALSEVAPTSDEFGLPFDEYDRADHGIRSGDTFASILGGHGVSAQDVYEIAALSDSVFDVTSLRAGRSYTMYTRHDLARTPAYLVYEPSSVQYVVFKLTEPYNVYEGLHPVERVEREVTGVITSSLYMTLVEEGVDPSLANHLSEVFAWQVDFYRIQPGDHFNVIYEERRVQGEPIGIGRIRAARLTQRGEHYYAFHFQRDSTDFGQYYDQYGESLRKAFLAAPVEYSRISSRYSKRRFHPVQRRYKAHLGTDYAAPTGTPIRATGDGVVLEATRKRHNGRYVKIKHNSTYTTAYLHMSRIAEGMRPGTRVRQGEVIGYVGQTGLATGPHVCYRFWKNGEQVDPLREKLPSANPLPDQDRAAFRLVVGEYLSRLRPEEPSDREPLIARSSPRLPVAASTP
jgi:murein DD-endopeptidase MepM/ murein hydrolase activator NlpD